MHRSGQPVEEHAAIQAPDPARAYGLLHSDWGAGFHLQGEVWVPTEEAENTVGTRYVDWPVTVPLLTVELLAVCSVAAARARALRFTTMAGAFLMIVTGYFGSQVIADGWDRTALVVWGLVSTVFFVHLAGRWSERCARRCRRSARRPPPACATPRSCCSAATR